MSQQHFVVSFFTGTSGRFISQLVYNTICLDNKIENITNFNSVHFNSFKTSYTCEAISRFDENIYSSFSFNNETGVFIAHKCLELNDFTILHKRYPNIKFIIISFEEADLPEIVGNIFYKNGFIVESNNVYNQSLIYNNVKEFYFNLFNKEYPYGLNPPPKEIAHQICNGFIEKLLTNPTRTFHTFMHPNIPDFAKEKTLILQYKQIFDVENLLETLKNFLQNDDILKQKSFAEKYIKGQKELVVNLMPWVIN